VKRELYLVTRLLLLLSVTLASCTTTQSIPYSREFTQEQDIVWNALIDRLYQKGALESREDIPRDSKIRIRRVLSPGEVAYYALNPPTQIRGPGEADISIWIKENPEGGSILHSKATIYAQRVQTVMSQRLHLTKKERLPINWQPLQREVVPIILESNGMLEFEHLGYSNEQAYELVQVDHIQSEFQKIKKELNKSP